MITPAEITQARAQSGFASKSREEGPRSGAASSPPSRADASSIPAMRTYPPSGRAEMTYSVSPQRNPATRGPKPMEKRGTSMSTDLAAIRCPSSWTKTSTPMTMRKATSVSTARDPR